MSRTIADASRDARKRKAEKMARYELALQQIAIPLKAAAINTVADNSDVRLLSILIVGMQEIARTALGEQQQ